MIKRIIKNIIALFAGNGVQLLTQLLLPPAFIAAYGIQGYGQWLVLFAAVGYVASLDLGLQTYLLNEVTILYHKGNVEEFHRVQSIGTRLILGIIATGMLLGSILFLIPLRSLLNVPFEQTELAAILYFFALQLLWSIGLVYLSCLFRIIGKAYRGTMWLNVQRLVVLITTIGLTLLQASFLLIAITQAFLVVIGIIAVIFDIRINAPEIFPRLTFWDSSRAMSMVKPSFFFGVFTLNNFLIFQLPLLVMNWYLGASVVAVFSIARVLFSFVRQGMTGMQMSISPEITRLDATQDHAKLRRLYDITESLTLSFSLILNFGMLIIAPVALQVWLRKPEIYNLTTFSLLCAITGLMSVKEAKLYFHYWTNNHIGVSIITITASLILVGVSIPAIKHFGIDGFLLAWLIAEFIQTVIIHKCNIRLIRNGPLLSPRPLIIFCIILACMGTFLYMLLNFGKIIGTIPLILLAIGVAICITFFSYKYFNLLGVIGELKSRWSIS